ncbi:hypothetical protein QUB72_05270 [Enterococcus faecium]|nr:hypothetical protein [Enterococcus faecium]
MKIDHEAYARKFHELNEEKINYTDIRFFDKMKEYPIYVNKEMMKAKRITPESFWAEDGIYRTSFLDAPQGAAGTEEELNQLNDRLFPDKDHLHIYLWNNEFTNYYNNGRYWDGAYVWSVYDEKESDSLFLMLYWYWIELFHIGLNWKKERKDGTIRKRKY